MTAQQDQTSDLEIALFVQREKRRLPATHHDFIDAMARRLEQPTLTPKQRGNLHLLFEKLGGKIT